MENTTDTTKPKKKSKCFNCKKKLGLMKYDCKCEHKFCVVCVLPESHNCKFNFVEEGKNQLESKLIKVVNSKIEII